MAKKSKKQRLADVQHLKPEVESEIETVNDAPQPQEQSVDKSLEVFLWLLAYSVLMFTLPFLGFYGVRSWLNESFPELDTFHVNCYSVLTAVLVVNAIVAMYVLKAMNEKVTPAVPAEERENRKEQ